jgi:beta-glucosidase
VSIDGEVVADDWDEPGPTMLVFPNQLVETRGSIDLTAGNTVDLLIELRAGKRGVLPHLRFGAVPPDPDVELDRAVETAQQADLAIVVVGTSPDFETEGEDRASFALPGRQDELVAAVAAAQPNTVVVVNAGATAPLPWADEVRAVLWTWYPGQEFGLALADVLAGEGEPGGRLPSTIPFRIEDSGAHSSYPGTDGEVTYDEGVFIGHRWFDEHDIVPQFCFGHGLSYTTFEYSDLHIHAEDDVPSVSVAITNVGERRGSEVVQLYVRDVESSVPRPPRELKAFTKVHLLPGETRRESFSLGPRTFAFYDVETSNWRVEPGDFEIQIGASSRDIRVTGTITM